MIAKVSLLFAVAAMGMAFAALRISISDSHRVDEKRVSDLVRAELLKRESEFVAHEAPRFTKLMTKTTNMKPEDWRPKTLEDLYEPFIRILEVMGETE